MERIRRASFAVFTKRLSVEPEKRSQSLAAPASQPAAAAPSVLHRLFSLPIELQDAVLSYLKHDDIFALRSSCKAGYCMLQENQHTVVRRLWKDWFPTGNLPCLCQFKPDFVSSANMPQNPTFEYYRAFIHRDIITARLAETLTIFVESKMLSAWLRRETNDPLTTMRWNLVGRLRLALMHLDYYWADFRQSLEEYARDNAKVTVLAEERRQERILAQFCIPCLLECYGVYELLFLALCRKLRPKTYAGRLERLARGWSQEGAPAGDIAMLLAYGGYDKVDYLLNLKPYSARRTALTDFVGGLVGKEFAAGFQISPEGNRKPSSAAPPPVTPTNCGDGVTDIEVRQKIYAMLSTIGSSTLFESMENRLLRARKNSSRTLLGSWEFAAFAMQDAPRQLNYPKIQEDWITHYAVLRPQNSNFQNST